jgi:hypothetical protein
LADEKIKVRKLDDDDIMVSLHNLEGVGVKPGFQIKHPKNRQGNHTNNSSNATTKDH